MCRLDLKEWGNAMFVRIGFGECAIIVLLLIIVAISIALSLRVRRG
jgi:hypothetical protein